MALDNTKQKAPEKKGNSDKDLVTMMGMAMLDNGGIQTIQSALQQSADPGQVVGQFVGQMIGQMAEYTEANLGIDPAVYAEPNGFLEQILDYIERKLGLPPEFSDQIYGEVLEFIKAAAQAEANGEQGAPQAPGAPAPAPAPGGGLEQMGGA